MTERELFRYKQEYKRLLRAEEELRVHEEKMYSAASPRLTFLPQDHNDSGGKLPYMADRADILRLDVERARIRVCDASGLLEYVEWLLDKESQREFLHYHYRKFLDYTALEKKLHRSKRSLYRDRRGILAKVAGITYII